jgi:CheY-like chemotaxis protein
LIFARRETIQPEVLDLNAVVKEVESLLSRTIGEHVVLVVDVAEALPHIRADRGQTEQVLLNLAVNARHAMPGGGTLTIETHVTDITDGHGLYEGELEPGRYVELVVSDTGVGMNADVMARAFEPFFTTKPRGEGSGLGLATVYGIVREAGGSIKLYSEIGIGTTVRIVLPAVDASVKLHSPSPSDVLPRGNGEDVLVVEDEEAIRQVAARILRRNGYSVVEAASAEEALKLAFARDFSLLLTDVVMPGMSGPELAKQLRARSPELPVLFMSGYSQGTLSPQQLLDDGVALLQKPFDERKLLVKVGSVLAGEAAGRTPVHDRHE